MALIKVWLVEQFDADGNTVDMEYACRQECARQTAIQYQDGWVASDGVYFEEFEGFDYSVFCPCCGREIYHNPNDDFDMED